MVTRNQILNLLATAVGMHSTLALALPQVSENAAQNVAGILTLYPDSQDPGLAYFVPDSATVARTADGLPSFGFTYWGLSPGAPDAGAYMTFSMSLQSSEAQASALRSFLVAGRRIAVVPFKQSMVRLTPTDGRSGAQPLKALFKELDFSDQAGPAEAEIGVNAILTAVGARVFKAAIENPQALKLDYCYQFDGLGPRMDAHVSVHWRKLYEDFQTHASVHFFWTRSSIDAEVERLIQNQTVSIRVRGGNATLREYARKVADDAVRRLFVPTLGGQTPSTPSPRGWSFSTFALNTTIRKELKNEEFDYSNQDLVEREGCLDLRLGDLERFQPQLVKNADAP